MHPQKSNQAGSHIERILDLARWAPSGDNTQPWRFEIVDAHRFNVHTHDTRDWCVYDLRGHASQIAVGALLETIAIASSGEGFRAECKRRDDAPETTPIFEVVLVPDDRVKPNPLLPFIESRTTQRRPMSAAPLTADQKPRLDEAVGSGFRVAWIEGWNEKWHIARLLYKNAGIRLTIPEAYEVHRRIIEWGARFSTDRIPDQAVGLDPLALWLMKWAMQSWGRVQLLNRYFAGTLLPRLQLDLIPALRCGAHFAIIADSQPKTIDDYLTGGRAVQRLWLTCNSLGLQFQPELTPLIFARYVRNSVEFTVDRQAHQEAVILEAQLSALLGGKAVARAVFMGRIGHGRAPIARSLRKSVQELLVSKSDISAG